MRIEIRIGSRPLMLSSWNELAEDLGDATALDAVEACALVDLWFDLDANVSDLMSLLDELVAQPSRPLSTFQAVLCLKPRLIEAVGSGRVRVFDLSSR